MTIQNTCLNDQPTPTNPQCDSKQPAQVNTIVFNLFFDGTWNNAVNNQIYNQTVNMSHQQSMKQGVTLVQFKNKLNKEYKAQQTSSSRAPSVIEQLFLAVKDIQDNRFSLYVDGVGTSTSFPARPQEKVPDHDKNIYAQNQAEKRNNMIDTANLDANNPSHKPFIGKIQKDSMPDSAFGMGDTGVKTKHDYMLRAIQQKLNEIKQKSPELTQLNLIFNVYGFSRGATTARMFCHNLVHYRTELEFAKKLNLHGHCVALNMVGLFDTVASIGVNHSNDTKKARLSLNFPPCMVRGKIVHIIAMNDYRQKFSVTNIQSAVMAGYGLEFAIPGCHTDIGDGLDTGGEFEEKVINPNNKELRQTILLWKHTSRDEKKVIIKRSSGWEQHLKQRPKLSPSLKSDRRFLPQVVDEEHLAEQQSCYADYDAIVQRLVDVGWGTAETIEKKSNWGFEFIRLIRHNLSVNYPKISASLMLEWIKNYTPKDYFQTAILKRYFLEADSPPTQLQIDPYPSAKPEHTVDDVNELYQIFLHLRTKMLALSQQCDNNVKYITAGDLCDEDPVAGEIPKRKACYLYVTDEKLRKRLYQHYLHWSTKVEVSGFGVVKDWAIKVDIGYINAEHRFYRKVYQG